MITMHPMHPMNPTSPMNLLNPTSPSGRAEAYPAVRGFLSFVSIDVSSQSRSTPTYPPYPPRPPCPPYPQPYAAASLCHPPPCKRVPKAGRSDPSGGRARAGHYLCRSWQSRRQPRRGRKGRRGALGTRLGRRRDTRARTELLTETSSTASMCSVELSPERRNMVASVSFYHWYPYSYSDT